MRDIIILMFVMVELVIGIQIFMSGLPAFLNPFASLLGLMFVVFNVMLLLFVAFSR